MGRLSILLLQRCRCWLMISFLSFICSVGVLRMTMRQRDRSKMINFTVVIVLQPKIVFYSLSSFFCYYNSNNIIRGTLSNWINSGAGLKSRSPKLFPWSTKLIELFLKSMYAWVFRILHAQYLHLLTSSY